MALVFSAFGLAGLFFCTAFQKRLDASFFRLRVRLTTWGRKFFAPATPEAADLILLQRLQAQLRSGHSLDGALELILREPAYPPAQKKRIAALLQGKSHHGDFLSSFLGSALESGIPVLSSLGVLQKSLFSAKRLRLKARAMTSQARAQAEVLSWLPWALAGGVIVIDGSWFSLAVHSPVSWVIWAVAFLLVGGGRAWMRRTLKRALAPAGEVARLEEEVLPQLVLRLASQISLGRDAETALDHAWDSLNGGKERAAFRAASGDTAIAQFQLLLENAARSGAPLREDLLRFLEDLNVQAENRWEERVQRLPVVMMMPLFCCFFPASLLVLIGLLYPLLSNF